MYRNLRAWSTSEFDRFAPSSVCTCINRYPMIMKEHRVKSITLSMASSSLLLLRATSSCSPWKNIFGFFSFFLLLSLPCLVLRAYGRGVEGEGKVVIGEIAFSTTGQALFETMRRGKSSSEEISQKMALQRRKTLSTLQQPSKNALLAVCCRINCAWTGSAWGPRSGCGISRQTCTVTGLPQLRKWSGKKKFLQGQGKVRKFYFESGKIDILKKSQGKSNYNSYTIDGWKKYFRSLWTLLFLVSLFC